MLSVKFFFTLAALVAVSAAVRTAPVGDGWVYAMQNNDFDFDGKNDATDAEYTPEHAVLDNQNPKIAAFGKKHCPVCGADVPDYPECNTTELKGILNNYYAAGKVTTAVNCGQMLLGSGTVAERAKLGFTNPHRIIPEHGGQTDLTDHMKATLRNPCMCWGGITAEDAEKLLYCTVDKVSMKREWNMCEDQKKLADWDLKTDGFDCEEAGIDAQNLTYSWDLIPKRSEWGNTTVGVYPNGGTAEDCADLCYDKDECGAFMFDVRRNYGPVDTHKRGRCTLMPKIMKDFDQGTDVDVKAPSNTKIGTHRFCVKNYNPRTATATSTCGSDSIEEQLDLVGLLNKKPLTPPLPKNAARRLIQKLKDQFRALKKEYRAAKENLRNKGRAAGDGV
jgi:hypothetical protein